MQVNGHGPVLAAAGGETATPIVGRVRARVAFPMATPATRRGQFGAAWRCDLAAIRSKLPRGTLPDAVVAHWVLEAPWSHQVIHSYSLMCVHLRQTLWNKPVEKYLEGATHEVCLYALHPETPRDRLLTEPADPRVWLEPMTFAAHIVALSDDHAAQRLDMAVDRVCAGQLSPHPSHARAWAEMFGDNMLKHAAKPVETPGEDLG